jgi:hypothetical protein
MAAEWYDAVCDTHKEYCNILVDGPMRTSIYLTRKNHDIREWLRLHYGCDLRLIHRDDELDHCYENGYESVKLTEMPEEEYKAWEKEFCGCTPSPVP